MMPNSKPTDSSYAKPALFTPTESNKKIGKPLICSFEIST
jgi:hypothetical protein